MLANVAELNDLIYDAPKAVERLGQAIALGVTQGMLPIDVLCHPEVEQLEDVTPAKLVLFVFLFILRTKDEAFMLERFCELPKSLVEFMPEPFRPENVDEPKQRLEELFQRNKEFEVNEKERKRKKGDYGPAAGGYDAIFIHE